MALDSRLLTKARTALAEKRRLNEERFERRLKEIASKAPRAYGLDMEIKATVSELVGVALGVSGSEYIEEIRFKNLDLQRKLQEELKQAGYPEDYLNEKFMCPDCHDTGYIKSVICDCLSELYKKAQREALSSLFKLDDETFDSFDLLYYDDAPAPDTGISPRRSMEVIYEICVEYARKFNEKSNNLFFNGTPGLGKTFLSACIARVVSENRHSVVYDTAASVFAKFEDAKFNRTDDPENMRNEIKRYLECDLLILDDLGTEMTTALTIAALYEIINTRLVTGRKTIVSTNLSFPELHKRYSAQIMSRLEGDYQVLTFRGEDIRKKRNKI